MLLKELDTALNALGTSLDDETMTISIEGRDINLLVDSAQEYLYVYSAIRKVDTSVDTVTLRTLLELNVMGKATQGGQVGLVDAGEVLLYSKRYRIENLTRETLEADITQVAETITKLTDQADRILEKASRQTVQEESTYDALSSSTAISYGWIQV